MEDLVAQARMAWSTQDWRTAADLYERLATAHGDDRRVGVWWYDAALAHKFLRNWAEAYRLGRFAAAHGSRKAQDPAFWNLGIAATIQRDWATAREAWSGYGITLPAGSGPIDGDFGRACVRLRTTGAPEVVWVQRLCPTRARVVNVPFDPSRRYGEIVVHDGEPKGDRVVGERTYRVFDELMLFEASPLATLSVTVTAPDPADLDDLAASFDAHEYGFEPLGARHLLCRCCSEGSVTVEEVPLSGEQVCLIAAPADDARAILDAWRAPGRSWRNLHPAT